ncbi:arylsulfatase [Runella zeae]|uniref:arylsulfatase n=1 Tax=Runella zeae TaxID=94255 RepID=UPI0003F740AC|nr:arylsulfatase [Runella zeae]
MKKTWLGICFLICLTVSGKAQQKNATQPNIVLIVADDLGYGDVGFNGQKLIKTPNLDRLAAQGMRFNQFYAGTTVCAPSRSALMTGQHTGHTYIRGNKEIIPEGQQPLAASETTIAEVLKKAGYTTAAFGKWGLGPVGSEGDPLKQGFDYFYGYNCQKLAHRYYPAHLWENEKKIVLTENQNLQVAKTFAPDLIQQQTLTFIDKQNDKQPFFLFLPYILPHAELLVPDDPLLEYYKGKFPEKPFKGADYGVDAKDGGYTSQPYPHATFAAMVARLDKYVGEVMDKLKAKGLDKNTIIIFSSDNGPHVEGGADPVFFNSGGGLRGVKRDLYEGGIRVPFVVSWPGIIKPNTQSDFVGAFWDLVPTLAELAHTKVTSPTDGLSFAATLTGKGKQKQHEYLYWEFHEGGGKQAVRQGNWKAVKLNINRPEASKIELYDLTKDSSEQVDLSKQFPDRVAKMEALMKEAHRASALFPLGGD